MPMVALSIAGSDPSGGAGIQADLKTFQALGVYGAAVITALTVQNTCGVQTSTPVDDTVVDAQLAAVLADLDVRATKTGMLHRAGVVSVVARRLYEAGIARLVVDPVLVATAGQRLTDAAAVSVLQRELLPLAALVTPNLAEATELTGVPVADVESMRHAARMLVAAGARAALVTGGHLTGAPIDVLYDGREYRTLAGNRISLPGTHGTGCLLSAAITAGLARGSDLDGAIVRAKQIVECALTSAVRVGRGALVPDHLSIATED